MHQLKEIKQSKDYKLVNTGTIMQVRRIQADVFKITRSANQSVTMMLLRKKRVGVLLTGVDL